MGRSVLQQSKQEALLYESINTLYHAFYKHSKTLEFKSVFYHTPNPNKTKHINKKPKCHSTLATHSTPSSSPTPSSPPSPLPPTTTPPTTAVRSPAPAPPLPTPASAPFLQTLTFTRHQRSTFSRASSLDSKKRRGRRVVRMRSRSSTGSVRGLWDRSRGASASRERLTRMESRRRWIMAS